jgi:hypothetical protein
MTCASWEAFCEDLAAQALRHLAEHATDGSRLPEELKKSIKADPTRKNQHELAVWTLEVPRAFRIVHPLGWTIWKGEVFAPSKEELLTGIQG